MDTPSENSGGIGEELRGDARKMGGTAKDRLHSEVDARKGEGASQAKGLSSALEKTASELGPDSPAWLKSALEQGAQRLSRLAESVEQKDSRQITRDVQQLARDHPGTFLAGCALAGFAAARVFKAGASSSDSGDSAGEEPYDPYAPNAAGTESSAVPFGETRAPTATAGIHSGESL